ncbi:MAG: acetyl-CoA C-acetyltransferase [Gammaproteobacteria bacterium]|nr:acetyl-CoA C-acetyltransferase [Pseudomonadales bacterium]MCP5345499.1 acetyl-CoA C-acetyltransferase [Pseudomonadales bacterium]
MEQPVIVAAGRTAIGTFNGSLASLPATVFTSQLVTQVLEKYQLDPALIDEVILGQVLTAGCGQNPARQVALQSGLAEAVPAMTINKVCGSGLKAVQLAANAIQTGDASLVLAGGMESMSRSGHLLPDSRQGRKMGHWQAIDTMLTDGLWDAFNDFHMGITAENLAGKYAITRLEQDRFAAASQQKAAAAQSNHKFDAEIFPVRIPQRRGEELVFKVDEGPRPDTTAENLGRLKPAFRNEGSVTAGNASGINDGAAVVVVSSATLAASLGLPVLARIRAAASTGVDPRIMGIGPVSATRKCLKTAGWKLDELNLIEANEAFAAQAIAVNRELGWNTDLVNVNGGAIALGHPIGASGCRVLVTLLHEMIKRDVNRGLATLCIGGGQGVAMAVERE